MKIERRMKVVVVNIFLIIAISLVHIPAFQLPIVNVCYNSSHKPEQLYYCCANYFTKKDNTSVHFVTFSSSNILDYSAYSVGINSAYADKMGYGFSILHENSFETKYLPTKDSRWFKVAILIDQLMKKSSSIEYFVWIDADFAVIDFDLDISKIGHLYPNSDIIMSKDIDKAPFVSNSGMVIVRNTQWAQQFLQLWWSSYDKNRCCDQNAFTWLYERDYPPDIKQKVALLPVNAINTDFPCWKTQTRENKVLHLAGLTALYREAVFKRGFNEILRVTLKTQNESCKLKSQLGLSRNVLLNILQGLNFRRLSALRNLYGNLTSQKAEFVNDNERFFLDLKDILTSVSVYRGRLLDILKFDDDENQFQGQKLVLQKLKEMEIKIRTFLFQQLYSAVKVVLLPDYHLQYNNITIKYNKYSDLVFDSAVELVSNGFEIILALNDIELDQERKKDGLFDSIDSILSSVLLKSNLPNKVRVRMLYYQFKSYQLRAGPTRLLPDGQTSHANITEAINSLENAIVYWQEMAAYGYYGTDYVQADPLKEISG